MLITEKQWKDVKEQVKNKYNIPDLSYDVWIKKLELNDVIDDCVIIKIPEGLEHAKAYIENKYKGHLVSVMNEMFGKSFWLEFVVEEKKKDEESVVYINRKVKFEEFRKKVTLMQGAIIDSQNRMIELENELQKLSDFLEEARFLGKDSYLKELENLEELITHLIYFRNVEEKNILLTVLSIHEIIRDLS